MLNYNYSFLRYLFASAPKWLLFAWVKHFLLKDIFSPIVRKRPLWWARMDNNLSHFLSLRGDNCHSNQIFLSYISLFLGLSCNWWNQARRQSKNSRKSIGLNSGKQYPTAKPTRISSGWLIYWESSLKNQSRGTRTMNCLALRYLTIILKMIS